MNKLLGLGLCAWLGLSLHPGRAAVWYVATNGSDEAAGTSWETAFATISNALATNAVVAGGHEVWVSNGTYALSAQLYLTKGVRLWGAYGAGQTILDGGGSTRCVFITNGVLDGFTVTNGFADSAAANLYGGGVYIVTGQVLNCTVTGNRGYRSGGGIYGKSGGVGVVSNCVIAGNIATNANGYGGGGGACLEGAGWRVVDCPSIRDNVSRFGGGMHLNGASVISNCIASNNVTVLSDLNYGGGLRLSSGALATHCTIASNSAMGLGGGRAGGVYVEYDAVLSNCTVIFNKSGEWGAGIGMDRGIVRNCPNISGNEVPGTGVKRGGGIYLFYGGGTVSDCIISNNRVPASGGGMFATATTVTVERCVMCDNYSGGEGGGFACIDVVLTMRNCLVTRNVSANYGGGVNLSSAKETRIARVENCTIVSNRLTGTYGGGLNSYYTNNLINTIIYSNKANSAARLQRLGHPESRHNLYELLRGDDERHAGVGLLHQLSGVQGPGERRLAAERRLALRERRDQ